MKQWKIAIQSLKFYFRTNLAIALGVAAATAVLTGALIIGDSMRHSLRTLTLDRLGAIDELLVSEGFFREALASDIEQTEAFKTHYKNTASAILFPGGTVEYKPKQTAHRAGQVTVLGIHDSFWSFENSTNVARSALTGDSAIINQTLADDLQLTAEDVESGVAKITVRVPKQTQLPADSALGRKTDLIESLVDLKVVQIIPTEGLGRFGMHPTQTDPMNVFVPIGLLQDSLARTVLKHKSDPAQANVLMIATSGDAPPDEEVSQSLRDQIRPTLSDLGLTLKRVTQSFDKGDDKKVIFDYWSLSSDKLVLTDESVVSIDKAFPAATPVFTYLANDIRGADQDSGVPFSMVSAIDFGPSFGPVSAITDQPIRKLNDHEIVLNQWTAADLNVEVGAKIAVTYFEPETTHGSQAERTVEFELVDIAKLTEPATPFVVPRRGPLERPEYDTPPTVANDADLTPEVPGVTDAESIENWDLPFQTADKLRSQDDEYWNDYRTTPKAFVSLATGQTLWRSRFGDTTSFRIPVETGSEPELRERLLNQFATDRAELGLHLVSIKRQGLAASSGSTPFDFLFLALSMFVIGAALILVSLLFRLGLQQRAAEVGLLKATGFDHARIRRLWLTEMSLVSLMGAVVGVCLGVGYAWLMIWGLSTWWVGAISRPFLTLHVSALSLMIGLFSGLVICVLTIAWSLRRTRRQSVVGLLNGELESVTVTDRKGSAWPRWVAIGLVVVAIGLAAMATQLSGEAQAGSFMGSGFLILTALLMFVYRWLCRPGDPNSMGQLSLSRLALMSAKRNPLRSTLTIGLVAVASFLITAVSAFRLTPSERGTAGFDWVAQSSQPIFDDLGTVSGQTAALGENHRLSPGTEVLSIRYKSGEDASCNNLYQSTQPRALGVSQKFVEHFDSESVIPFAWNTSLAKTETERQNPWQLLDSQTVHSGAESDPIPVVMDKNTANYSLKIYSLNTVKRVEYDTGETIYYRVVGMLENTILQGSLIMSEADFVQSFPATAGYQYFLIRDGRDERDGSGESDVSAGNVAVLEERLGDLGFDARSAPKLLANFMAVQNTYLSTFQTLGALGLLLGTFGLAAVQIRSVLERKKELGLMRAVGFGKGRLSNMVLMENAWLLMLGLAVGIGAALFTTVPHWFVGTASVPWLALAAIFAGIIAVGIIAGWLASRLIAKMPLLDSLRT